MSPVSRKCSYGDCNAWSIKGGTVCNKHGGSAPQVKAKAAVRAELMTWKLGDALDDPAETLLRLITQSRRRADALADELEQLVLEEPNLRDALVGETWVATEKGDTYKAGEYIRGLAQLEAQERDRLAGFASKAVAAGLAERMVAVAEKQAALAHAALVAGLDEAGITGELRAKVIGGAVRHLRSIAS